jgi:putative peptide zinc metalloprotease protein
MTTDPASQPTARWCRTAGTQQLGEVQGSGLRNRSYLLRRGDGQVVQVSHLLYLVTREVSADREPDQVASAVSAACGRELTVEGLNRLLTAKLEPIGLVEDVSRRTLAVHRPRPPRSDPLLALRFRRTMLPAPAVRACARVLAPLFRAELMVAALAALAVLDVVLVQQADLGGAVVGVLATPAFLLLLLGLLSLGAFVHELGHAAACIYGGAEPGVIGFGVYLVFPAFYTDVTDSYRLDRAGRIRTDLAGLYFNVWCLLVLGGSYLVTGQGIFLLAALLMHLEMLQQLIPTVRFDGYFLLSDLAGVPDLFARMRPVLRSMVPGRPMDPRLAELRPAARRMVIGWVVVVTPLLAAAFGWLLYNLPSLAEHTGNAIGDQVSSIADAWPSGFAAMALGAVSIVLLCVPLLGVAALLYQIGVRVLKHFVPSVANRTHPQPTEEISMSEPAEPDDLTAGALTDETVLGPPSGPRSESVWRRAVYRVTGGAVDPGPTSQERRRAELLARVTAPIRGSRRVVVMSRKGGVGKTTITMALGSTYSTLRGDRVVAVDANPDAGNLAHRVSRPCPRSITNLLDEMELVSSYADLRDYTAQAPESRLEVLASDDDPRIGSALDRKAYQQVIELLDHYYNLILLDTGTGILDSANQGLLADADQLIVVLRPALDGARAAALTLDWLSEHGYGELVARAVVVINGVRRRGGVPLDRVKDHFARRCAHVVCVPWDHALETGARTTLSGLAPATRQALTELAAAVADHFTTQTYVRSTDRDRLMK